MFRFSLTRAASLVVAAVSIVTIAALGDTQTTPQAPQSPTANPLSVIGPKPMPLSADDKKEVLDSINDIIEKRAYVPGVDFDKWSGFEGAQKAKIDKADNTRDFAFAINEALSKFGFSHIVLITPDMVKARLNHQSVGIGVMLQAEDEGMRVLNVFDDTPAKEAGIVVGDLIIEGNGKKPKSPLDLMGDEGTVLNLKVKSQDGKVKEYKLTRHKYNNIRVDTLTWPKKDTAMVTVHTFDIGYDKDHLEDLMKQAAPAKNLIIDLRSNPGGKVLNLTHFMGLVLPPGTPLGTFISKYTVTRYLEENKDGKATDLAAIAHWAPSKIRATKAGIPPFTGHIAVLINGGSGSAAEIAAAALRDNVNAPVLGTRSAGAVLVSMIAQLPDDFMLQYPVTDFVTMEGVRLEGTGVTPVVETPGIVRYNQPDPAVDKAVLLLQRADLRDGRSASGG